ncbi:MAG TPA: endoglucanase [Planctomycetaceae bacterium]|nr:endoglucanase [Planctomycetaceae bacterium]
MTAVFLNRSGVAARRAWGLAMLLLLFAAQCDAQSNKATFEANQRLGRGVNLGNFLEAPRDANWGADIRAEHFALIRQAGFNSVRLPVRWSDYAAKTSPFTIEQGFFVRVDRLLTAAESQGLNVVLNIHHFEGLDAEPDNFKLMFKSLWEQIASRYQSRGEFLYFELNNEPHANLNEKWNDVLRIGLAAVRESNPTRPVIVGPPHWNGIWALDKLHLPDDPNLIVTVHMYNPHEFTHQGASWASPQVRKLKNLKWGAADEVQKVERELADAAKWGKQHGRPLFLGEFGAYEAAPMESRVKWTKVVAAAAEKQKMTWAYWEFCAGFGVYDTATQKWNAPLMQSLGLQ